MTILRFYERFADKIATGEKHATFRRGETVCRAGDTVSLRTVIEGGETDIDLITKTMIWRVMPVTIRLSPLAIIETLTIDYFDVGAVEAEAFAILDGFDPDLSAGRETSLAEMGHFLAEVYPGERVISGHVIHWIPPGGFDLIAEHVVTAIQLARERLDVLA